MRRSILAASFALAMGCSGTSGAEDDGKVFRADTDPNAQDSATPTDTAATPPDTSSGTTPPPTDGGFTPDRDDTGDSGAAGKGCGCAGSGSKGAGAGPIVLAIAVLRRLRAGPRRGR